MSISKRIHDTLEVWQAEWKDRLAGWLVSIVISGFIKLMDALEDEAKPSVTDFIAKFPMPPEMKADLEAYTATRSAAALPIWALMAISAVLGSVLGSIMGWATPIANWTRYVGDKLLKTFRLDPASIITAWRRDPAKYEKLFDDLKEQGWSDERIEALKFFTLYFPSPAELIHWQAREVFEPKMIARYGLMDGAGELKRDLFYKAGMDDEQIDNHWMAHWEHASYMQIREMLHRGVLSESPIMPAPPTTKEGWATRDAEGIEAAYDWYRLVEIPPFWRPRLTEMMFEVPTRVDVRRWWDMRTISEERLYSIYHSRGYHGKDLDDYVLWTKVYTAFPDLIARMKNGWISPEDVGKELEKLGMPPERVQEMIETKIKPEKPAQVIEERQATATEIMKGVKKEFISWSQGVEMLGDLGYDKETAEFKLTVYGAVAEGSPETYPEFKLMTQAYRKAMGLKAMEVPQEIIEASKELAKAKTELSEAEEKGLEEAALAPYLKAESDAKYRYRQLLVKWEEEKKKSP